MSSFAENIRQLFYQLEKKGSVAEALWDSLIGLEKKDPAIVITIYITFCILYVHFNVDLLNTTDEQKLKDAVAEAFTKESSYFPADGTDPFIEALYGLVDYERVVSEGKYVPYQVYSAFPVEKIPAVMWFFALRVLAQDSGCTLPNHLYSRKVFHVKSY